MGKTPAFGMVSCGWLLLALAGCDTLGSNDTSTKTTYQPKPAFNNQLASKTTNTPATTPAPDPTAVPDRSFVSGPIAPSSGTTPGAAGMLKVTTPSAQVQVSGSATNPFSSSGDNVTPAWAGNTGMGTRSTSDSMGAPYSPGLGGSGVLPSGSAGNVMPPPPGSASTTLVPPSGPIGKPLPPATYAPPPPPALPNGVKSNDGPPLPEPLPGTVSADPPDIGKVYTVQPTPTPTPPQPPVIFPPPPPQ